MPVSLEWKMCADPGSRGKMARGQHIKWFSARAFCKASLQSGEEGEARGRDGERWNLRVAC